jgi:hypothetical protein
MRVGRSFQSRGETRVIYSRWGYGSCFFHDREIAFLISNIKETSKKKYKKPIMEHAKVKEWYSFSVVNDILLC